MQQKVRDRVVDGDKNIFFGVVMGSSTCPRVILQCLGFFTVHTIERMHDSAVSSSRPSFFCRDGRSDLTLLFDTKSQENTPSECCTRYRSG